MNGEKYSAGGIKSTVAKSRAASDAELEANFVSLQNEMKSIMAGLSCGTPSKLAFDVLNNLSDFFIKCSDDVTEKGMQILGRQEFGDTQIISGESGAGL